MEKVKAKTIKTNSFTKDDLVKSDKKKGEKHPPFSRVTKAPFEEAAQQELKVPESLFAEHNKERVLRSASVSSLFTQGMVKVRERTRMTKERKDMDMK